jgi:hypothetical protein
MQAESSQRLHSLPPRDEVAGVVQLTGRDEEQPASAQFDNLRVSR